MNEVNTRTHHASTIFVLIFFLAVALIATSCNGDERHADKLWRQATERVAHGDTQGAVDRLQTLVDQYPNATVADKARAQLVVYRGLLAAVEAYPTRRARQVMVQLARAIESFRGENRRLPASLDELVPARIASVPLDPWNRPFAYVTTADGYRLSALGADGAAGGDGDAADWVVIDGAFVEGRR
jgi:hypothetical protein